MGADWNKCFANIHFKILECMGSYSTEQCKDHYAYAFKFLQRFAESNQNQRFYCPKLSDFKVDNYDYEY